MPADFELYTDGACSGNPGPGGWCFILRDLATSTEAVRTGGEAATTNNRMEMRAVIEGLGLLEAPSVVELWADSTYVLHGLEAWLDRWKANGWRTSGRKPVKNRELWHELDRLRSVHDLRCHWVRGHKEHPENLRCDVLAVEARDRAAAGTLAGGEGDC